MKLVGPLGIIIVPINSFVCQRRSCQAEFDANFDPTTGSPFCPTCGGKPCKWIPRAVNTGNVARQMNSRMDMLVKEHNERVSDNPYLKISNIRCERGEPAVRMPPPQEVKRLVQMPDGKVKDVPVPGFKMPDVSRNVLAAAGLLSPSSREIPVNKDGRPPTEMTILGGVCPRPPLAPPIVVHKG